MKRTKRYTFLIITFILVLTAVSFAQEGTKVAIVNSQEAFETSAEGKKAAAQMQERDKKIRDELQKMDDAIRSLQNRLNTGQLTMTPEAIRNLQVDIDKKTTDRKRYEEDAARDFQQFQLSLVNRIREEMVTIIMALRKERGYDLVIDLATSGIVDFDPTLDVTAEVVRRYDASKQGTPPVKK